MLRYEITIIQKQDYYQKKKIYFIRKIHLYPGQIVKMESFLFNFNNLNRYNISNIIFNNKNK